MRVLVTNVHIPAWSTLGYGKGIDEEGDEVAFVGDHRPMRDLGEALRDSEEPIEAEVGDAQLIPVGAFPA